MTIINVCFIEIMHSLPIVLDFTVIRANAVKETVEGRLSDVDRVYYVVVTRLV